MAAKASRKKNDAQLAFEALSIEGGLLSPEWLGKVAQLGASQQSETDYGIRKGLNLRDELGRYWRIAQAEWAEFDSGRRGGGNALELSTKFTQTLLKECFGFASLASAEPITLADRLYPLRLHAIGGRVPVIVAPAGSGLDTPSADFGDGTRKRSAFGLTQEYLNAEDKAVWGIATDGLSLRIVRDNASLTRPAWIEVDLARLFAEARYADFTALWLLMHESRFGREGQAPTECALEQWRTAGREQGTRARDLLRDGVQDALVALGQGFLSQRDNQALRDALKSGSLTERAYFQQLLRLVYRLIFLITAEERDLLFAPNAPDSAKQLYAEGYGLRRLRERSAKRRAHDRYTDLYDGLKIVFRGLEGGQPVLGLPALAGLFSAGQTPALDSACLENHSLLEAVFRLSWIREGASLSRVNWRDMGPEELGSVYESLLELVPVLTSEGRVFGFASADESKGNARKTTGSYYTPDSLVQVLLDRTLEPVVQRTIAANPVAPVDALLKLSIVDPACGSGHFLLAAARRLAAHVARLEANGTPSPKEYRHALRRVVGQCVFGVDLNPMAIELCRLALWMEAVDPGKPLSFLDSHLQQGNALLGSTPELMKSGIPDDAWVAIDGDDKKSASALKKRNKKESLQDSLALAPPQDEVATLTAAAKALDAASDADVASLAKKQTEWTSLLESVAFQHQKLVADAWCAAFVWPKEALPSVVAEAAPTNETWRQVRDAPARVAPLTVQTVKQLARQYEFLHWHMQFPQVFTRGGFDVVLGNPPWERVKLQEQEFFASRSIEIATAESASARKRLISKLPTENPDLWRAWNAASRLAEGQSHFVRNSGRYPLCGNGDVNTYALFAEHNQALLNGTGRAGFVSPSGLVTDETTKDLFQSLVASRRLAAVFHFENESKVFPGVHHAFRFLLLCTDNSRLSKAADLVFFARQVADLAETKRHFTLSAEDFDALNPNTKTCPTFRSKKDADLNLAMYRRAGVLWREDVGADGNPWDLRFLRMFDLTNDSGLFLDRPQLEGAGARLVGNRFVKPEGEYLPLAEAKMFHHFDHRFGTYDGQTEAQANQGKLPEFTDYDHGNPNRLSLPFYWVAASEVESRLAGVWNRKWVLGWRDITGTEKQRTIISAIVPLAAVGNSFLLALPAKPPREVALIPANLNSFACDYAARQKVGGTHLNYLQMKQLPVLRPTTFGQQAPWNRGTTLGDWLFPRVLELTYTAWDLEPFARDVGHDGPPFKWDPARRFLLRCELDAAFFLLYGISHDDAAYILDTFPIVKKNDEKTHGEYRTKRVILEVYDALAAASKSERPYQTVLSPPPADPSVAHPDTRKVKR